MFNPMPAYVESLNTTLMKGGVVGVKARLCRGSGAIIVGAPGRMGCARVRPTSSKSWEVLVFPNHPPQAVEVGAVSPDKGIQDDLFYWGQAQEQILKLAKGRFSKESVW